MSREYCPSMPLPVPPDYIKNLSKISEMATKGVLPPPLKMILEARYPLLVQQQPSPTLPPRKIPPSLSPLPCAEPESLGNDQIERKQNHLKAQMDDDIAGKHKDKWG